MESKEFAKDLLNPQQSKTKTQIRDDRKKEKELAKQKNAMKKAFEDIEEEVSVLEQEHESIELQLCDEVIFSSPEKTKEFTHRLELISSRLSELYELWEEHVHE